MALLVNQLGWLAAVAAQGASVPVGLLFTVQPTAADEGAVIGPPVVVWIVDDNGDLVDADNEVTLALTVPGSATLGGTLTKAAVGGVAIFDDLTVDVEGSYTLTATSTDLVSAVSDGFNVAPSYFTTFQPELHVDGAIIVTNGAELMAAIDAVADGGRIELSTPGAYTLTANKTVVGKSATIAATAVGTYIDGAFYIRGAALGYTVTLLGLTLFNSSVNGTVYGNSGHLIMRRCYISTTGTPYGVRMASGTQEIESCIIEVNHPSNDVYCILGAAGTVARNCILYVKSNIGRGMYQGYAYNCAAYGVIRAAFDVMGGGDYNLSNDNSAPGANSTKLATWGDNYDANYVPLTALAKNGGDLANRAVQDYYGNVLAALGVTPIGAIAAP